MVRSGAPTQVGTSHANMARPWLKNEVIRRRRAAACGSALRSRRGGVVGASADSRLGARHRPTCERAGHRVLFVTNNSATRLEVQEATLEGIGIPAVGDVLTSAQAAALLAAAGRARTGVRRRGGGAGAGASAVSSRVSTEMPTRWSSAFTAHFDFDGLDTRRACCAARGSPDRHERRRHVSDARRADSRWRVDSCRGGDGVRVEGRRWPASRTRRWRRWWSPRSVSGQPARR